MNDHAIIQAARRAEKTGDFAELERFAEAYVAFARARWAPHETQDRAYEEYNEKPWWKRIFLRRPRDRALPFRVQAYEDLQVAEGLLCAARKRDVAGYTG